MDVREIESTLTPQEMEIVRYHRRTIARGETGKDAEARPVTVYSNTIEIPEGNQKGRFVTVPGYFDGKIHDNEHTDKRDNPTDQLKSIRSLFVNYPAPEDSHDNKDTTVGGIYLPKVGGLKCGNNSIENKDDATKKPYPDSFTFSQPKPDQISTADFA